MQSDCKSFWFSTSVLLTLYFFKYFFRRISVWFLPAQTTPWMHCCSHGSGSYGSREFRLSVQDLEVRSGTRVKSFKVTLKGVVANNSKIDTMQWEKVGRVMLNVEFHCCVRERQIKWVCDWSLWRRSKNRRKWDVGDTKCTPSAPSDAEGPGNVRTRSHCFW